MNINCNLTDEQLALYLASIKGLSVERTLSIAECYYEWLKSKQKIENN
jgi:ribosome-binding factor A